MTYDAVVTRTNPTLQGVCFDASTSMADLLPAVQSEGGAVAGPARSKAEGVADAVDKYIAELVILCAREEGVRDYFSMSLIGYGQTIGPRLGGPLAGKALCTASEIGNNPLRIDEQNGVKHPVWMKPEASGSTPMAGALDQMAAQVEQWIKGHPDCFPPVVVNITDGEADDQAAAVAAAARLRALKTTNGHVLLFNVHISGTPGPAALFPNSPASLADPYAKLLFEMSSVLPEPLIKAAAEDGLSLAPGARGFAFNADLAVVTRFLEIGSRVATCR